MRGSGSRPPELRVEDRFPGGRPRSSPSARGDRDSLGKDDGSTGGAAAYRAIAGGGTQGGTQYRIYKCFLDSR